MVDYYTGSARAEVTVLNPVFFSDFSFAITYGDILPQDYFLANFNDIFDDITITT